MIRTEEDAIVAEQNAVARELRNALGYEDPDREPLPVTPALAFRLAEVAAMAEVVKRLRDERDALSVELTEFDDTLTRGLGSYGTIGRAANLAMVRTLRNFLDVVAADVGVSGETLRCDPAGACVLLDERRTSAFKDGQLHEAERMAPVVEEIAEQKDINHRRVERLESENADIRAALTAAKLPAGVPLALGVERLASLLGDVEKERNALRAEVALLNIYRQRREPILTALGGAREECASLRAEVERLTIECDAARKDAEELRLTLLAEQGNAEGAPSKGWQAPTRVRRSFRREGQGWLIDVYRADGGDWTWDFWRLGVAAGEPVGTGTEPTARAAMQAADRALFESRRAACVKRALKLKTDGVILWPPNGAHQQTPTIMIDRLSDPALTEAALAIYEKALFP